MESSIKSALWVTVILVVGIQALTGFAAGGQNIVPSVRQTAQATKEKMAGLWRPNPAQIKAVSSNVVYLDGKSVIMPIKNANTCPTQRQALLQNLLNAGQPLKLEHGQKDKYGRIQGRIYTSQGVDIALKVENMPCKKLTT